MKKNIFILCLVAGFSVPVMGQELTITPIWEYLNTSADSPLPILKPYPDGAPQDAAFDALLWGETPNDSYGALKRYDENRLLLAVRENGINESEAGHDAALAAAYPDRSLIWINAADGSPMGIALIVGFQPVELDRDFLDAGGSTDEYYFNFGVSEDGVIFTNYKNKILRYDPDGAGGFTGPAVAYTVPDQGAYWPTWRFEDIEVWGSGADIEVLAGGKTWRDNQGYRQWKVTEDGTLELKHYIANVWADHANGGMSKPVIHGNSDTLFYPDEYVIYGNRFPGGDGGTGHIFNRWFLPSEADIATDPIDPHQTVGYMIDFEDVWMPERPSVEDAPKDSAYRIEFCTDFDSANGLSYVIAYSVPSWNTPEANEGIYAPGWLAIHDCSGKDGFDGAIISAYRIDTTELTESTYSNGTTEWHGTLGEIDVNVPAAATANSCEILWSGAIYGYGRYVIGDIGEPVGVLEWQLF